MDHSKPPCEKIAAMSFVAGIREILARAEELEREGHHVIHLEIGRPDFDSPERAKRAAIRALEDGHVHYTDMSGTIELREAIAAKFKRDAGMIVDPKTEIIVTLGGGEALLTVMLTTLNDGDEVIVPTPFFPVYEEHIILAGGKLVKVPCKIENDFRPDPKDIERAITPKTRMILINTPNNPTGASSTREELEAIAEIAKKHDLYVLSDECYEYFAYDPKTPHISIASLPGMRERTFTISSSSKTFSMTGWRVGWIVAPPEMKKYLLKSHQAAGTCANTFAQYGVAEALLTCWDDVHRMIEHYRARRDIMVEHLSRIPGFEVPVPSGAFYIFPSIQRLKIGSFEFAERILEEHHVALTPGQPFGAPDGFLRLAYCRPEDEIGEAADRIEKFVKSL